MMFKSCLLALVLFCVTYLQGVEAVRCKALYKFCNDLRDFTRDKCVQHCVNQNGYASGKCEPIEDHVDDVEVLGEYGGSLVCACRTGVNTITGISDDVLVSCWGEPHCTTADGTYYHPQPVGRFVSLQNTEKGLPNFRLLTTSRKSRAYNFPGPSATIAVSHELQIYGQAFNVTTANYTKNVPLNLVTVNGEDILAQLPYTYFDKGRFVNIYRIGQWIFIDVDIGLQVQMHKTFFLIRMPNTLDYANVRGMWSAGQKDGDPTNDHVYPNGTVVYTEQKNNYIFTNDLFEAWDVDVMDGFRRFKRREENRLNPCTKAGKKANRKYCIKYLEKIESKNPFSACLTAEAEIFREKLESCTIEMCIIPDDETGDEIEAEAVQGLCGMYDDLEKKCEAKGHVVGRWRKRRFCPGTCEDPNAKWSKCVKGAEKSCNKADRRSARLERLEVIETNECFSGCHCQKKHFLHPVTGLCVPKADCP